MTSEEFKAIQRQDQWPGFWRLAKDLRAVILDFDYVKTRKALDPNWNGYDMPKDHDIVKEDADLLTEANLVTSRVKDSVLHRPVLDLDQGAQAIMCQLGNELRLNMKHPVWYGLDEKLFRTLNDLHIAHRMMPRIHRLPTGHGRLDLRTDCEFALIDSSTVGHKHLILKADMQWKDYINLLNILAACGIIEQGYARASIKKGYSAIRPPWVHK